jgi:NAD-dependent deacetylase
MILFKKNQKKMNNSKKIVVFSGSGISKESGSDTFRDKGGLWEQYDVEEFADINGWYANPELMMNFYNYCRTKLKDIEPNDAHRILAELEKYFDTTIITQNVDNLHEKAGSTKIIHLHGELTKARSSDNPDMILDIGYNEIRMGEKAPDGSQIRPHVVWFGEDVPMLQTAIDVVKTADIFVIIGTSLNVYPAAGLIRYVRRRVPIYLIDPDDVDCSYKRVLKIQKKATDGMRILRDMLLEKYK